MGAIVDVQLRSVAKLLQDRKMSLELTNAAHKWLADVGYSPYGFLCFSDLLVDVV